MPDYDDELKSQGERMNALASVVDVAMQGMAGDFRRTSSTDIKVATQAGRQSLARDILARRRKSNARVPVDLGAPLKPRYRDVVKYLGPATLPLIPPGMLQHYVRALDALDSFGHMIDHTASAVARSQMLEAYARQARQVAALAKACNISTHSNVMQLAVISELRVESRASAPAAPVAADWRQHAMTLEPDDES